MAEHAIHGNYGVKQVVEAEDELASLNNAQGPISCHATQGIEYAKYKGGGVRIMMCVVCPLKCARGQQSALTH